MKKCFFKPIFVDRYLKSWQWQHFTFVTKGDIYMTLFINLKQKCLSVLAVLENDNVIISSIILKCSFVKPAHVYQRLVFLTN